MRSWTLRSLRARRRFACAGELLDEFHAVHLLRQLGKDRGLVAEPGADLEHPVARLEASSRSVISATMKGCEMVLSQPIGSGRSS